MLSKWDFLLMVCDWNMNQHGVLCTLYSPTCYVKYCQLMTTACKVLFIDSLQIKKMDVVIYRFFAYPRGALIEYSNILKFSLEVLLLFFKENLFPAHCQTVSPLPFPLLSTFGNVIQLFIWHLCRVLWLNYFDQGKTVKLQNQIFCSDCENVI